MSKKLYSWETNINFSEKYKKNAIEDDIIPDSDLYKLEQYIKSYCSSNYNPYHSTGNSGYSVRNVDGKGTDECNGCDTTANCYKASINCSTEDPENCPSNCPGKYKETCANPGNDPSAGGAELAP